MSNFKRLKDPIYGYINLPIDYMSNIVDTASFQRLRRVIQTSYSPLYSSAVHNRFVHSLGVYHLGDIAAITLINQLNNKVDTKLDLGRIKDLFLLACLLHDVGHAPFLLFSKMMLKRVFLHDVSLVINIQYNLKKII